MRIAGTGWYGVGLWLCALVAWMPARIQAQVAVLAAADAPARPGFVQSLRIHLPAGVSVIEAGTLRASTSTSERIDEALTIAAAHHAHAAVWIEGPTTRADAQRELVLYVVGRRNDRAIVDVLRINTSDDTSSSIDRSLALKASHVLSDVARGEDLVQSDLASTGLAPARKGVSALVLLGAALHFGSGSVPMQPGLRVGAGVQLFTGAQTWGALLRMQPWSSHRTRGDGGLLALDETSYGLELTWLYGPGPLAFGGRVGALGRDIEAQGTTVLGAYGQERVLIPGWIVGPSVAWTLHPNLRIDAGVIVEGSLRRHDYALNDSRMADTGRVRASLHAELVGVFP